jgi:hypothetical protein
MIQYPLRVGIAVRSDVRGRIRSASGVVRLSFTFFFITRSKRFISYRTSLPGSATPYSSPLDTDPFSAILSIFRREGIRTAHCLRSPFLLCTDFLSYGR